MYCVRCSSLVWYEKPSHDQHWLALLICTGCPKQEAHELVLIAGMLVRLRCTQKRVDYLLWYDKVMVFWSGTNWCGPIILEQDVSDNFNGAPIKVAGGRESI